MPPIERLLTRRAAAGTMAAVAASAALPMPASAADQIQVVIGAEHSLTYLPWDLAAALGYFKDEGLNVAITYAKGGAEAAQALVSGSADYSGDGIDHAINAQSQGKDVQMIVDFMDEPGGVLLIRPGDRDKYKSIKDFKGRTVGVSSVGSAQHVIAVWMAHVAGMARDDVNFIGVGTAITMVSALEAGRVDATMAYDPFASQLVQQGKAAILVDLVKPQIARQALGFSAYSWSGCLTRGEVIRNKAPQTQKVVNALVRAMKFMATHTSQQVAAALPDEMRLMSVADWVPGYSHIRSAYTNHGAIALEAVQGTYEANRYFANAANAAPMDLSKLFTNTFVEKANATVKV